MTTTVPTATAHREDGLERLTLRTERIEVTVVPEIGGKVLAVKNLRTGRDWFAGDAEPKLFRNQPGDDFAASMLTGWDECLPTVARCEWSGRVLPDHGEVWNVPWRVDSVTESGLRASVTLANSPFRFSRELFLNANVLTAHYSLTNTNSVAEKYLWAMHPLIVPRPGDGVVLTSESQQQLSDAAWLDTLDFGPRTPACAKVFAAGLTQGSASVVNHRTDDRITFEWDTAENDTLGIWLTRGGWHGCHHLALEPANTPFDSLADAAAQNRCSIVGAGKTKTWTVRVILAP